MDCCKVMTYYQHKKHRYSIVEKVSDRNLCISIDGNLDGNLDNKHVTLDVGMV